MIRRRNSLTPRTSGAVSPDIETEPKRSPARPVESINWTGTQRGAATIVVEVMNNSAELLAVEPQALVATHH